MRIVVTGASGRLGAYLSEPLKETGWDVVPWSGETRSARSFDRVRPVDLADPAAVDRALREDDPAAILHAGAMSAADQVFRDQARARAVNVESTRRLAEWCRDRGRRIVFTSTDMVFDGARGWYGEGDEPNPILAYGLTKRDSERAVLAGPGGVVARLSLLFGPARGDRPGFYDRAVEALRAAAPQSFFEDEYRTPLDYRTAARALVALVGSDFEGVLHLGGRERLSRFEFMKRVANAQGIDASLVRSNRRADAASSEPRPADLSLDTTRLEVVLPGLERPAIEEAVRRSLG